MRGHASWLRRTIPPRPCLYTIHVISAYRLIIHRKTPYLGDLRTCETRARTVPYLVCAQLILFGRSDAEGAVDVVGCGEPRNTENEKNCYKYSPSAKISEKFTDAGENDICTATQRQNQHKAKIQ